MKDEHAIPNQFVNELLTQHVGKSLTVSLKFKRRLKDSIELFVHFLLTHCEEITHEKGHHHITATIIKEALQEINREDLLALVEARADEPVSAVVKRAMSEIEIEDAIASRE